MNWTTLALEEPILLLKVMTITWIQNFYKYESGPEISKPKSEKMNYLFNNCLIWTTQSTSK